MVKTITYKIKFIESFRFILSSLSSIVDNLTQRLHNDKYNDCKSCLKYVSTKDNRIIFKCLKCNKRYEKEFNKDLIKRFANI